MLTGGFLTLAAAYLSPLATDPTYTQAAWAVAVIGALLGLDGWRRTKTWNPGDYA
jgi:hypothetical protein